jgi:hypothetical protein
MTGFGGNISTGTPQNYGADIQSGCTNVVVVGNNVNENVYGMDPPIVVDSGSATSSNVANNSGFNPSGVIASFTPSAGSGHQNSTGQSIMVYCDPAVTFKLGPSSGGLISVGASGQTFDTLRISPGQWYEYTGSTTFTAYAE